MQTQPVSGTGPGPSGGQAVPPTTADAFVQVLVEELQQVRAGQAWEVAVALLGRSVTAIDPTTGAPLGGTVVGILRGATGPLLQVGGTAVPLESVTSIP